MRTELRQYTRQYTSVQQNRLGAWHPDDNAEAERRRLRARGEVSAAALGRAVAERGRSIYFKEVNTRSPAGPPP